MTEEQLKNDGIAELGESSGLSQLLKSNALLRGVLVPLSRFAYQANTEDGVDLDSIDLEERVRLMWAHRFPAANISEIKIQDISPDVLPLVWISGDKHKVGLVRGKSSSGFLMEGADGTETVTTEVLQAGKCLLLPCDVDGANQSRSALKLLAQAMMVRKRVFLEAIFATFMISTLGIMSALYTMQVYDRVVPNNSFDTLIVLSVGVLLAVALEWLMKVVRAHMVNRSAKAIDIELADTFFGKALSIRADRRPKTVGTFAAQVRQYEQVRNFATTATLFVLADAPFAFFFIGVIALIAGPVAFVPLAIIPLAVLAGWVIQLPIERLTKATIEESNKKNGLLIESIDGIESVKSVASEWKLKNLWHQLTVQISKNELKTQTLTNTSSATTQSFQQISYIGIVAFGAFRIAEGELTIGGLIACSIIAGRALAPLAQIPQQIVQWKQAKIGMEMLDGILSMPNDRDNTISPVIPASIDPGYQLNEAKFHYDGGEVCLSVGKLDIVPGEKIALLGAVGSGKSTLIKLLSGLYQPTDGKLLLGGVEMSQVSPDFLTEQIGYLPQDVRLFSGSLRDNLTLGLPLLRDEDLIEACKLTGLDRAIANHPRGMDLEISEGGKGLSGGQRQLVGLTRLLLARPKILLLDEPTASMDANYETFVMTHLFEHLAAETTIFVATHKASILNHVERVLLIDEGEIVLDGPREEILARMQNRKNQGDSV